MPNSEDYLSQKFKQTGGKSSKSGNWYSGREQRMFTAKQEKGLAEMFARLRAIMVIDRELALTGLPLNSELDQARDGLNTAYACLEKLVGKEKN